ncbi:phage tail sheath family protein [Candidatus Neomicrothrix sp.]|uniref:phage tail sheath family protein n=1 Tax=Candidatus Neomicrothrix sp. TaxID=2719034 RepID=UPI002CD8F15B|nr:phage tail sheath subtilisin-like domain-containing protein [Candidatus Microthrix sp.]HMS49121.1 phage tail sheath subtilisin-like domain-containing protein [Candidatus Microthrix sp.]
MPEYLAPGVYIEETSYRAKSIEGVSTSTAGFVGPTRTGPVSGEPEMLTSFTDFERIYGGLEDLGVGEPNYLAHGVKAFFDEGGRRIYVVRVFGGDVGTGTALIGLPVTKAPPVPSATSPFSLKARFPGTAGQVQVTFSLQVGPNQFFIAGADRSLTRIRSEDTVAIVGATAVKLAIARQSTTTGDWTFTDVESGTRTVMSAVDVKATVHLVKIQVEVARPTIDARGLPGFGQPELLGAFSLSSDSSEGLTKVLAVSPPTRVESLQLPIAVVPTKAPAPGTAVDVKALVQAVFGTEPGAKPAAPPAPTNPPTPPAPVDPLVQNGVLRAPPLTVVLANGGNGTRPSVIDYQGHADGVPGDTTGDTLSRSKNGLLAFEGVEDISIIASPGSTGLFGTDPGTAMGVRNALVAHCEQMRYRVAVLDTPPGSLPSEARTWRNSVTSDGGHGALYHPWVVVQNPFDGSRLVLPPSGFVAGIWARNDTENAVFKAPANEPIRSAIELESAVSRGQQEMLNPEGVNCLRYFPGRGNRVWGARTISDDPEWKYVSLRRYFAYLEHSIERGTQWAVFMNNGEALWANVRRTIEEFLLNEWKTGGLLGASAKEAYFVECERKTMTQNDLDNGRLVCKVGVAAVKPAEFVIFRIGQWTASATS